jgi:phosphoglycerate dehydrogenase-like enzyme
MVAGAGTVTLLGKRIAIIAPALMEYRLSSADRGRIEAAAPGAALSVVSSPADFLALLPDADIAAGHIGNIALAGVGRLSWFHSWAAGVDHEPVDALHAAGVTVTCSKGNGAIPIAEFTTMAMLAMARRIDRAFNAQRRGAWDRRLGTELSGSTLGLIGLGHIGQEIVRRAELFGVTCIAVRRDAGAPLPPNLRCIVLPRERMRDMLGKADFVVAAAPLTPETKGLLGEEEFRAMKSSAIYICVSRGGIADEEALRRALAEGWIGGAWLDAHAVEPLPPESPFWTLPNTVVTPHTAGATRGTAERALAIFVDNLSRAARGEPLRNQVRPGSHY